MCAPARLVRLGLVRAVAQEAADGEQVGVLRVERAAEHLVRLLQHRQRLAPLALRAEHLWPWRRRTRQRQLKKSS